MFRVKHLIVLVSVIMAGVLISDLVADVQKSKVSYLCSFERHEKHYRTNGLEVGRTAELILVAASDDPEREFLFSRDSIKACWMER